MIAAPAAGAAAGSRDEATIDLRFAAAIRALRARTDRFFSKVLLLQWLALIVLAVVVTPLTWEGRTSSVHLHVLAAIFLGGVVSLYPAWLGWRHSGDLLTRHVMAVGQMLASVILIHITGGRIETHFHIFASLAILALYRDPKIFVSATVVVYLDHLVRGLFWPESVFGVLSATPWRALEHAGWVMFEVAFLVIGARVGLRDMRQLVSRQVDLENSNNRKEREVLDRTRELAASAERFRTFFQESPVGLYRVAPSGEFLMVNPALLSLLGFASLEELVAARATESELANGVARRRFIALLLAAGKVLRRDTVWIARSNEPLDVRESGQAVYDADRRFVYVDGTVEDVTQFRQLEERYRQAIKVQAIGQLAGGVAHDFNNILTVINGNSQMLLMDGSLDADAREGLGMILDGGKRAAELTRQLLAFSRKQRLEPKVIYLDEVASDLRPMLSRLVGENIAIRIAGKPGLAPVRADPAQIQQVILNLVVNSRDAMPEGGEVVISTTNIGLGEVDPVTLLDMAPGDCVLLSVSDTGSGMTPDVMGRLFEPFFTTKPHGAGTGLGLASCYGVIKQSGGHIAFESHVGKGTTCRVYLPVATETAADPTEEAPVPGSRGKGERILLVEDDRDVREFARKALTALGYLVTSAENGIEAIEKFGKEGACALLFTDVIMPGMGGRKLVEHLHQVAPDLPVLYASGHTFGAFADGGALSLNDHFISKPYSLEQLQMSVSRCINVSSY
jgi:PAS domain S-box-containing protein